MKNIIIAIMAVLALSVFAGCTQQIINPGPDAKLEPGSYSETILDPKAPVVTESFKSVQELSAFIKANSGGANYGYAMAGGMRATIPGDFAAQSNVAETVLERAFDRVRKFADGILGRIAKGLGRQVGHESSSQKLGRTIPAPNQWQQRRGTSASQTAFS